MGKFQTELTKDNLLRMLDLVTEEERSQLEATAISYRKSGVIDANPAGPKRYRGKIYGTEHCTPLIAGLGDRIAQRLGLTGFPVDPYLGYTVSLIEPGGFINEHVDRYGPYLEGSRQLRCNIMVSRENDTYDPVICNMLVNVPERSAWAFYASECLHATQEISGPRPRIIFGFGWVIPEYYVLQDNVI